MLFPRWGLAFLPFALVLQLVERRDKEAARKLSAVFNTIFLAIAIILFLVDRMM